MERKNTDKNLTFKFFNAKWSKVPTWAEETEDIYRNWYYQRYPYFSVDFIQKKKTILDAGCGLGRDSKLFAELNPTAKIIAVDQSSYALKIARKNLKKFKNCKIIRRDITKLNLKERFDFISCDQVIHHTPDPNKTLKILMNHLNSKGIINFSVCRKKNKYRDFVDDTLMDYARDMTPADLWYFSTVVTMLGEALYNLNRGKVFFEGEEYESIQRFIHDNIFRCWYNPKVSFDLSVSSNYDWFSSNPRFDEKEVRTQILKDLPEYKELSFYKDKATISVSLQKL